MASTRTSFNKAAKKIVLAAKGISGTVPKTLRMIGEEIKTDVNASAPGHGVPVDTGTLRSTGMVTQPAPQQVDISYGGAAAPYALAQHENMQYHHKVGEPRYLVRGLERWQPGGSSAMAALKENADAAIKAAAQTA